MKTPEEIIEPFRQIYRHDAIFTETSVLKAMEIFGKQCFEAAKSEIRDDDPNGFDILVPQFRTFEDYLKSLEDEKH